MGCMFVSCVEILTSQCVCIRKGALALGYGVDSCPDERDPVRPRPVHHRVTAGRGPPTRPHNSQHLDPGLPSLQDSEK